MIKTFFIVIIFTIGGEQKFLDGWHPRQSKGYEVCQQGASNIREYFIKNKNEIKKEIQQIEVSCRAVLVPALES